MADLNREKFIEQKKQTAQELGQKRGIVLKDLAPQAE